MKLTKILREIEDELPPEEETPEDQPPEPKSKPKEKKEEGLKYECRFVNGGFNDGVKIEPTNGGKLALSISIYGGGEPKNVNIPASPKMSKIIQGYEVGFKNQDSTATKMEPEIDQYIETMKQQLSFKIMDAMREFDMKVKQIIIETVKGK